MKNLFFVYFLFLAFDLYANTSIDPTMRKSLDESPRGREFKTEKIKGLSKEGSKSYMPGRHHDTPSFNPIKGSHCQSIDGKEYTPKDKGYRKCINQAHNPN